MTAKSTKSKTNRKKTGTTSKKSTSNKKTTKKNTKKTTRSTRTAKSGNSFLMDEILIWITLAVSIILLISNFGVAGFLGDAVSGVLWEIFGAVAYIIPFVLFGLVSFQVSNKGNRYAYMKTVIAVLLLFLAEILLQLVDELGGKIGKGLASVLTPAIGVAGTYVVTVILMIICLVIITGKSALKGVKAGSDKAYARAKEDAKRHKEHAEVRKRERMEQREQREKERAAAAADSGMHRRRDKHVEGVSFDTSIAKKSPEVRELPIDPKTAKGPEKPEFIIHRADPEPADYGKEDMTNEPEKKTPESENDPKTQEKPARRKNPKMGAAGMADEVADVAASVAADSLKPKKEYQYPPLSLLQRGKRGGGESVVLRDLLESPEFKNSSSKISFAVGKDIGGKTVVADIAKMPHVLIAGATGSGKSVCINTLIMSVLYKADPNEVKLIMIDPKVVELSVYNGIPHLLIPVVTDPKKAAGALNWAVGEMSRRYQAFAKYNVRDMKGYNEKIKSLGVQTEEGDKLEPMPQIIIIVDELADLMMVAPGDVEEAICRLAQLARAAGIHLVLATQRPSVNVITGLIKANMPSRIAFSVSSGVDSRTIIDMNGAEKLLGKGDMLFYPSGYQKPARVQGSFVTDKEVQQVVEYLREHNGDVTYNQDIETHMNTIPTGNPASGSGGSEGNENDAYFADAGRLIIEKEKASIGMLQRAFKIGFNRAARIMDQLCEAGAVGPEEGTKPRKVLMSSEEFEQYLNEKNG